MKKQNIALVGLCLVGILLIAGTVFLINQGVEPKAVKDHVPDDQGVACTEEAKICPDGSAVGREGPNCEFPDCPNSGDAAKPE